MQASQAHYRLQDKNTAITQSLFEASCYKYCGQPEIIDSVLREETKTHILPAYFVAETLITSKQIEEPEIPVSSAVSLAVFFSVFFNFTVFKHIQNNMLFSSMLLSACTLHKIDISYF
jgi:hypothetical protein